MGDTCTCSPTERGPEASCGASNVGGAAICFGFEGGGCACTRYACTAGSDGGCECYPGNTPGDGRVEVAECKGPICVVGPGLADCFCASDSASLPKDRIPVADCSLESVLATKNGAGTSCTPEGVGK